MAINISIQIEPGKPMPVQVLRDTAKYLLALSGALLISEGELKNGTGGNGNNSIVDGSGNSENIVQKSLNENFLTHTENPIDKNCQTIDELDSEGKPWDYKIHSSTKVKTKDGKWKAKRGIEQTPSPTVLEPVPPPIPAEDLLGKLMSKITEKIVSGKMTHNSLAVFLREHGIPDVPSIQNFPHLFTTLIQKIEALA